MASPFFQLLKTAARPKEKLFTESFFNGAHFSIKITITREDLY